MFARQFDTHHYLSQRLPTGRQPLSVDQVRNKACNISIIEHFENRLPLPFIGEVPGPRHHHESHVLFHGSYS
jgi:hypothetical protein